MTTPSGRILTVGAGQQFSTLNGAVTASHDGDVIQVQAGTYVNDFSVVTHSVTIEGVGGMAHLISAGNIPNGKAILIDDSANLTIANMEFSGAQVGEGNGAGIRYEAGNLVVTNSSFHDNEEGILGGHVAGGNVTIDSSSFVHNGAGDGQTHGAYLGTIDSLTVTNSFFQDQIGGSDIKSRAASNHIEGNQLVDTAEGSTNYQIDLPNGGNDVVLNNVVHKSANADNRAIIHFGGEVANATGSLLVQGNQFGSDRDPTVIVLNQSAVHVALNNNSASADVSIPLDVGPGTVANMDLLQGVAQIADVTANSDPQHLFDPAYFVGHSSGFATKADPSEDPLTYFATTGWKDGDNPNALFNVNYYLAANPDVAAAGMNPLLHYELYGWKEGRNPSPVFSTDGYLSNNGDVKLAGMDPLLHYLDYGISEGRSA